MADGQEKEETLEKKISKLAKEAWEINMKKLIAGEIDVTERGRLIFDLTALNVASNMSNTIASINSALANTVNSVSKYGDMALKQALESEKIGTDRQWNVDEQGYTVEKILRAPFWQDLVQAIAVAVASAMKPSEE